MNPHALSPAEMVCPDCKGVGFGVVPGDPWRSCPRCDRQGRVWLPGGPAFDCSVRLADVPIGSIVILPTGHRGQVTAQFKKARRPLTLVRCETGDPLAVDYFTSLVAFPSEVGVSSVADRRWFQDESSHRGGGDVVDPLRAA